MPAGSKHILLSLLSLWAMFPGFPDAQAMSFEQMKMLPGTALLELRIDAVLTDCGLPSLIADTADASPHRQAIRWGTIEMNLSAGKWEIVYSRQNEAADRGTGWINPDDGSNTCLSGLTGLVLQARGDAGILSTEKRADNKGYLTSYLVPDNLFTAHQVIGLTGGWKQGMPVSKIQERYGNPDEILEGEGGLRHYRYWVVVKQNEMPVSLHAVDFEVKATEKACSRYTVLTTGSEFVQEKFDALERQWLRDYVLD